MYVWNTLKPQIHNKWRKIWYERHPSDIAEYSWNYLFTGGKEIRPILFCELWHYLCPDSIVNAELAFAIECIHVASIILDDTPWMDNASERRGKPTLHTTFTPNKSLMIANDVIAMAVEIWKTNKPNSINEGEWYNILSSKLKRLIIGQWYDLDKKGSLIELASLKTGILFELVTETVAICTNLDTDFWKLWGNTLGILFQWMDDYLDMEEDAIQCNRNAFNEDYQTTLNNYTILWQNIAQSIGNKWFNKQIGVFMKTYFLEKLRITHAFNECSMLPKFKDFKWIRIVAPEILFGTFESSDINKTYDFPMNFIKGLTRDNIISRSFKLADNLFLVKMVDTTLWNMTDKELEEKYSV